MQPMSQVIKSLSGNDFVTDFLQASIEQDYTDTIVGTGKIYTFRPCGTTSVGNLVEGYTPIWQRHIICVKLL